LICVSCLEAIQIVAMITAGRQCFPQQTVMKA